MTLPIIPEYTPPHWHLAEVPLLITAAITYDGDIVANTASIAGTPDEVPGVLADIIYEVEELSQEQLHLIASLSEMLSDASLWSPNELTGLPHKLHVMIEATDQEATEVYIQVFTLVKAERIKGASA